MKMLVKITRMDGTIDESVQEGQWDEMRGCWSFTEALEAGNGDEISFFFPVGVEMEAVHVVFEPRAKEAPCTCTIACEPRGLVEGQRCRMLGQ